MSRVIEVDRFINIVRKSLEAIRGEVSGAFYAGADVVLNELNKYADNYGDLIRREDAVRVVALVLCAEAQTQGYHISVADCIPEAAAWVKDYCPPINEKSDPTIDCPGR